VTVYLTEMHVNKMLSVHKDGSPWVWSRSFLLRLIAAVITAAGTETVTEAITADGAAATVTPFATVTEVATTATATATATTDIITQLAAIYS